MLEIYKVYHWDETTQYDKATGQGGPFTEYVNMFLKVKQEASGWPGWPEWVKTIEDKTKYISDYAKREGVVLDAGFISKTRVLEASRKCAQILCRESSART